MLEDNEEIGSEENNVENIKGDSTEVDVNDFLKSIDDDSQEEMDSSIEESMEDDEDGEDAVNELSEEEQFNLDNDVEESDDEEEEAPQDDDDIFMLMSGHPTYQSWMEDGKLNDTPVEKDFAVMVAKSSIKPEELQERELYSMEDIFKYIDQTEEVIDPEARFIPKDKEGPEWDNFIKDNFDIPSLASDYKEEVFDGKDHIDSKGQEYLRTAYNELALSNHQAEGVSHILNEERIFFDETRTEEEQEYASDQITELKSIYGDDYSSKKAKIIQLMKAHGADFYEEFKGTRIMKSANFQYFIDSISDELIHPDKVNFRVDNPKLDSLTSAKLQELKRDLLSKGYFTPKYENSDDKKLQKSYKKALNMYYAIENILKKRV